MCGSWSTNRFKSFPCLALPGRGFLVFSLPRAFSRVTDVTITVVNRRKPDSLGPRVYVGRGSPLGNPFEMQDRSDAERNRVCDEYEPWLRKQYRLQGSPQRTGLDRLVARHRAGEDLRLECFCAPKRCHADFVKHAIERLSDLF
jgi:hypothetical protein